jgi:hypothetical protein
MLLVGWACIGTWDEPLPQMPYLLAPLRLPGRVGGRAVEEKPLIISQRQQMNAGGDEVSVRAHFFTYLVVT